VKLAVATLDQLHAGSMAEADVIATAEAGSD
jgi:hypothetical protein